MFRIDLMSSACLNRNSPKKEKYICLPLSIFTRPCISRSQMATCAYAGSAQAPILCNSIAKLMDRSVSYIARVVKHCCIRRPCIWDKKAPDVLNSVAIHPSGSIKISCRPGKRMLQQLRTLRDTAYTARTRS